MTWGPTSTTTPAGSSPKMAGSFGSGKCGNHLVQLASTLPRLGTMPQAFTCTSTSAEPGFGTAIVSIDIGPPTACMRAARMVAGIDIPLPSPSTGFLSPSHRSEAGPIGLLVEELAQALAAALLVVIEFELYRLGGKIVRRQLVRQSLHRAHRLLAGPQRMRILAQQQLGKLHCSLAKPHLRHGFVDQPHFGRLLAVERNAGEDVIHRIAHVRGADDRARHRAAGDDPLFAGKHSIHGPRRREWQEVRKRGSIGARLLNCRRDLCLKGT